MLALRTAQGLDLSALKEDTRRRRGSARRVRAPRPFAKGKRPLAPYAAGLSGVERRHRARCSRRFRSEKFAGKVETFSEFLRLYLWQCVCYTVLCLPIIVRHFAARRQIVKSIIRKFLSLSLAVVIAAAPLTALRVRCARRRPGGVVTTVNERTELNAGTLLEQYLLRPSPGELCGLFAQHARQAHCE